MFLLFTGEDYYPEAGWNGYRGVFDSIAQALRHLDTMEWPGDWWQIVDLSTLKVCDSGRFTE